MAVTTQGHVRAKASMGDVIRRMLDTLDLDGERRKDFVELLELHVKSSSKEEREEIVEAICELAGLSPIEELDNPLEGVSPEAKVQLANYRTRVGRAIRQRRSELGLTQAELARGAGLRQSHVSRLESGKHAPSALTLERIAKAMKINASDLDPGFG